MLVEEICWVQFRKRTLKGDIITQAFWENGSWQQSGILCAQPVSEILKPWIEKKCFELKLTGTFLRLISYCFKIQLNVRHVHWIYQTPWQGSKICKSVFRIQCFPDYRLDTNQTEAALSLAAIVRSKTATMALMHDRYSVRGEYGKVNCPHVCIVSTIRLITIAME